MKWFIDKIEPNNFTTMNDFAEFHSHKYNIRNCRDMLNIQ